MTEQVIFTNEDGEDIRFYVVEETKIAGVNYLLVTEQEEDEQELDAISKVFAELLEDVSIEMQE